MPMKIAPDLRDSVFGKLVVVDKETDPKKRPPRSGKATVWYCVCECGNPAWYTTGRLKGGVKSCGCDKYKSMRKDITDQRFGKLVALEPSGKMSKKTAWLCRCDCGKHRRVRLCALMDGSITSCGCDNKSRKGRKSETF